MFKIAFTGTQHGMTERQMDSLRGAVNLLGFDKSEPTEFHHGGCIGADAQAHAIAVELLGEDALHIHPCDITQKRAAVISPHMYPVMRPLVRNRHIVDGAEVLLAAPKSTVEELRSGTWATMRYARKMNVPVLLLGSGWWSL